jgi:hypothetical protein
MSSRYAAVKAPEVMTLISSPYVVPAKSRIPATPSATVLEAGDIFFMTVVILFNRQIEIAAGARQSDPQRE